MPIKTSKRQKKYSGHMCVNCFFSYKARYDHHTVLRCKEHSDKVVKETENCDKYCMKFPCSGE